MVIEWTTALIVAAVITASGIFTAFLPQWSLEQINNKPADFLYGLLKYTGGQYFAVLISPKQLQNCTF